MSIGERVKKLRKVLNLTQSVFAERIGLKQAAIGLYENGQRNIGDRAISDICREFNVNENWLRFGEGEMFNELSKGELAASIVGKLLATDDEFIQNVFIALGQMSAEEWKFVKKFIDTIKGN